MSSGEVSRSCRALLVARFCGVARPASPSGSPFFSSPTLPISPRGVSPDDYGPRFLLSYFYFREKRRPSRNSLRNPCGLFARIIAWDFVEGSVELVRPEISRRFGAGLLAAGGLALGLFLFSRAGRSPSRVCGITKRWEDIERVFGMLATDPGLVGRLVFTRAKIGFLFTFS